jgi:uncharacterized protein
MADLDPASWIVIVGFACGAVLGVAGRSVRFCTFGAIEDAVMTGSTVRLRTWVFAMAVAIAAVQVLSVAGLVRLDESLYMVPRFQWGAALGGGLMFGFGMALAGNCGYGTIVRMSSGDMRAMCVFVLLGLTAYVTARGILNPLRHVLTTPLEANLESLSGQGIGHVFRRLTGLGGLAALIPGLAVAGGLAGWCLSSGRFRRSRTDVIVAIAIGLAVAGGFAATSVLGEASFEPVLVESVSYALPPGETLIYLMTFTGARIDFPVATVLGTVVGAFAVALLRDEVRLEGFDDARDMRRNLVGAALMGVGGVTAGGCTVGQGLSGMATLSMSAPLAVLGIIAGAAAGVQYLIGGRIVDVFKPLPRN